MRWLVALLWLITAPAWADTPVTIACTTQEQGIADTDLAAVINDPATVETYRFEIVGTDAPFWTWRQPQTCSASLNLPDGQYRADVTAEAQGNAVGPMCLIGFTVSAGSVAVTSASQCLTANAQPSPAPSPAPAPAPPPPPTGPPSVTQYIYDQFATGTDASVSGRTPDTLDTPATTWAVAGGTITDYASTSSVGFSANGATMSIDSGLTGTRFTVTVNVNPGGADNRWSISLGNQAGNPNTAGYNGYQANIRPAVGQIYLYRMDSGAALSVGSTATITSYTSGSKKYTLDIDTSTGSITVYENDVSKFAGTDTTHTNLRYGSILHALYTTSALRATDFLLTDDGTTTYSGGGGTTVSADAGIPLESTALKQTDTSIPVAWQRLIGADSAVPTAWLAAIQATASLPDEVTALISADAAQAYESLAGVQSDATGAIEWAQALGIDAVIPLEWGGALLVFADSRIPVEWSAPVSADSRAPVETSALIAVDATLHAGWLHGVQADTQIVHEALANLAASLSIPVEWRAGLTIVTDTPMLAEWTAAVDQRAILPVEWLLLGTPFIDGVTQVWCLDAKGNSWKLDSKPITWKLH